MSNATAAASTLFLGHNANWWDFWLLISVVVVAPLAAAVIGFTTAGSIISNKREAGAAKLELQGYQAETAGKVADAEKAGIAAGEQAGHAKAAADDAIVKLKQAEATIAQANAQAANAQARAAEATLALERLRTPRTLSSAHSAALVAAMRPYAGKKFDMAVVPSDPEAITLLGFLEASLRSAGLVQIDWSGGDFVISRAGEPIVGQFTNDGVVIAVNPSRGDLLPAANAIVASLVSSGIDARAGTLAHTDMKNLDALHVLVGKKLIK